MSLILRYPSRRNVPSPVGTTEAERNVIRGKVEESKKSGPVRCVSRPGMPVSRLSVWTLRQASDRAGRAPSSLSSPSKVSNFPRTFETMACRTEKPTMLLTGSSA